MYCFWSLTREGSCNQRYTLDNRENQGSGCLVVWDHFILWSRKTKHEVYLILHRVPWGKGVSLLPSWRLWVLYNSVHKGLASHNPVINKWAAVKAKPERGLPLSCRSTCFHSHRAQAGRAWRMAVSAQNSRESMRSSSPVVLVDNSSLQQSTSDKSHCLRTTKWAEFCRSVNVIVSKWNPEHEKGIPHSMVFHITYCFTSHSIVFQITVFHIILCFTSHSKVLHII